MSDVIAKQQVNLLDQGFRRKAVPLSGQVMIAICLGAVIVLGVFYAIAKVQVPKLQAQSARLTTEYRNQQARLSRLSAKAGQSLDTSDLDAEIERLVAERKTKSEVVSQLAGRSLGNTTGFSPYLEGLARQILTGVWLREITIHNGGNDLYIAGSTLDPRLVPRYLGRLSNESAFSGTDFSSFEMHRREKQPGKVDFVVKTSAGKG
jgi:Tfp pilus assembly protein PilN